MLSALVLVVLGVILVVSWAITPHSGPEFQDMQVVDGMPQVDAIRLESPKQAAVYLPSPAARPGWSVEFLGPYEQSPRISICEDLYEPHGRYQFVVQDQDGDAVAMFRYREGVLVEIAIEPKYGVEVRTL